MRALVASLVAAAVGCSIYNSSLLTAGGGTDAGGRDVEMRDVHRDDARQADAKTDAHNVDAQVDAGVDSGPAFASCQGGGAGAGDQCGPSENVNCCTTLPVPGGNFYRDALDGGAATVSSFHLDQFEVTVGRFRKFVNAGFGTQLHPPAAGSGANPHIPGSGWNMAWNSMLATATSALTSGDLTCGQDDTANPTWTDTIVNNESLPINCVTWFEAFAFCVWDGGRLPTDTEWDYAGSGGAQDRYYPWSPSSDPTQTKITPAYASYLCQGHGGPTEYVDGGIEAGVFYCSLSDITPPGHYSPMGDGLFGQADLAGNMNEWVLDYDYLTFPLPCDNCADLDSGSLDASTYGRLTRSGGYDDTADELLTYAAFYSPPTYLSDDDGIRCARDP
jgi:sulfatase modifying factor 1